MAAEKSRGSIISYEEGWAFLEKSIDKVSRSIEGTSKDGITSEEYMRCYTIVYELCKPAQSNNCSQQLYEQYKISLRDYLSNKVLPSLIGKKGEILLQELGLRWSNYMTITSWLSRFFKYLDRYYLRKAKESSLEQTSLICFHDLVLGRIADDVLEAALLLIDRLRCGDDVDGASLKSIVDVYVTMGKISQSYYEDGFEKPLLEQATAFYSGKASKWIGAERSYADYMIEVNNCLKHEEETILCSLPSKSQEKLLQVMKHELLSVYAKELEERKGLEDSFC